MSQNPVSPVTTPPTIPQPVPLSEAELKAALPDKFKKQINQELVDSINQTLSDPDLYEIYRDNLVTYASVLREGRFKLTGYLDAVKYVTHKLAGRTNMDAYTLTFPAKVQNWTHQGMSSKDMASYVTAYNKSKLVTKIMEQTLIPSWILNQDLYQKALNVQAELMVTANSEKVRSEAANSILTHLKMPESQKIELDIGVKQDSSIHALREATLELVDQQRKMIENGVMTAKEAAEGKLVIDQDEVEFDER